MNSTWQAALVQKYVWFFERRFFFQDWRSSYLPMYRSPFNVHVNASNNNLKCYFNPTKSRPFLHNQDYHMFHFLHWKTTYPFPLSYLACIGFEELPSCLNFCLYIILCYRWKDSNYSASAIWQQWTCELRSFIKGQNLASREIMRSSHGCAPQPEVHMQ